MPSIRALHALALVPALLVVAPASAETVVRGACGVNRRARLRATPPADRASPLASYRARTGVGRSGRNHGKFRRTGISRD